MTPGITQLTDLRGQLRRADKIMTTEEVDAFLEGAFLRTHCDERRGRVPLRRSEPIRLA